MSSMVCICKHGERYHVKPVPYPCRVCDCGHFRWNRLDWNAPGLVELVIEASR